MFVQQLMLAKEIFVTYINPEEFMQLGDEKGRFDIFLKCVIPSYDISSSQTHTSINREFIVLIENKVSARETRKNGRGQTEKYKEYIEKEFPDLDKIYVLLSPNLNSLGSRKNDVDIKCDDFIRLSYQDILTHIIEPLVEGNIPNKEDTEKLKDYIKCLSIPALEEGTNNEKVKSLIMAMSSKETRLLLDFWNSNEDLIKACLSAIANNEEFPEEARKIASKASTANYERDRTKYKLGVNATEGESRSKLVPMFIERWAKIHGLGINTTKDETLQELQKAFPGAILRGGKNSRGEIVYGSQPQTDYKERNFPSIIVGDYTFFVAANIWTKERFAIFIKLAAELSNGDPNLSITVMQ